MSDEEKDTVIGADSDDASRTEESESSETGGEVDASERESSSGKKRGGPDKDQAYQRVKSENKEMKRQLKELQRQFAQLQGGNEQRQPPPKQPDFWSDPVSVIDQRAQQQAQRVFQLQNMQIQEQEARKYLESIPDFEDNKERIFEIARENGLDVVADVQPLKAAKAAIALWRSSKESSQKSERAAQAAGVMGQAPASGQQFNPESLIKQMQSKRKNGRLPHDVLERGWEQLKKSGIAENW